jgi:hypothetical protein
VVEDAIAHDDRHRQRDEPGAVDADRMQMSWPSRCGSLLRDAIEVVVKEQSNRGRAHGGAVPERTAGKDGGGQRPPIPAVRHCLDDPPGALAVTSAGLITGDERIAQRFLVRFARSEERFGDGDGHLRVIGVDELRDRRIFDQLSRAPPMSYQIAVAGMPSTGAPTRRQPHGRADSQGTERAWMLLQPSLTVECPPA